MRPSAFAPRSAATLDIRNPIWRRLAAVGSGTVFLACAAMATLSWIKQSGMIDHAIQAELTRCGNAIFRALSAQSRIANSVAVTIAAEPDIAELVTSNARDALIARYSAALPGLKATSNIGLITFSKAPGVAVARVHAPEKFGDNISHRRRMISDVMRDGKPEAGIEPALNGELTTFATAPLVTAAGTVGAVDVGTKLTEDFFERLKKDFNIDLAVQIDRGDHFETQVATFPTKTFLTETEARSAVQGLAVRKMIDAEGKNVAMTARPILDYSGHPIGLLEIVDNVTPIIQQGQATLWTTIIGSIVIAALSLALFVLFAISLSRPIRNLTLSMHRVAAGDLQSDIEGKERSDEIGAMAEAVQVFKDNAVALEAVTVDRHRMEAAAETEREQHEAERRRIAQQQADVVRALAAGLERLSEGDLTSQIDAAFAAEYEKLKADFNAAVSRLRQVMEVIVETTDEIRSGAGEITQASDDLSHRTEQQAASLEETAAALDEITATVKKSAEGASHARQMVAAADDDAKKSKAVVREAIQAMDGIAKSAQQISQIIGVIDEIAFQTNLLALNAGVEAARAGEAGRGFAVVASEVRALAQRSAEAAKEIKALISTSTAQVDSGVALVADTGKALERIMAQVTEINTIVIEIATGAKEQATGLAEINTAVNQMDEVTQKNAAMVEESTIASHSLAQETEKLAHLIGQFRIGSGRDDAVRRELQKVAPHAFRPSAKMSSASRNSRHEQAPKPTPLRASAKVATAADAGTWEEF